MITKDALIEELSQRLEESEKEYDLSAINHAITFAILWHDGQFRSSGEEYVCHPLSVAIILAEIGMDTPTIEAAILHDAVEDTEATLKDLLREFGREVTDLVDGVTKIDKLNFGTYEEQQAENIRKMLIALGKDARVIIIKLADRLHNLRTIDALPSEKRLRIAKETMDVYAPIAHRIGMQTIKDELEDLSLRTLDPIAYQEIEDYFFEHSGERKIFLDSVQDNITNALHEYGMHPTVSGRVKSITSTYRKTFVQGKALDEVYDVFAVRIIVDTVNDCYNALGIVHELFRPIPGRFKDYISTPKPNMYQSLHTTVISSKSVPFEVQIRTWDMHYTAEYGIAAHWKYKAGVSGKDKLDERLKWVRQFIENQEDGTPDEIIQTIKTDLSPDEAFVFTPKGDVINLPTGSTVIDFAYAIHSAVGNRMIGAKVDGRIVPLDYAVHTGEIIEIITTSQENHGPSRDWLNVVKTSEARSKIRTWFKKECREE
ncbi:MAG: bifunctional (p)ppGpp synthetase/guanosine-3',5'-bis(diphosphate) 3'-pyrophosphohydrolase, partial [Clostridia bacterium]|nr:bifunctional (p)ppGpp synthetase/guanosine-3',5'-bis(diphosphate) 3'-pyrophosphohydrolase [Clostridia bacterium]